jgi:uncharacterized membrane protein YphA (DoxX/SURF4 family)
MTAPPAIMKDQKAAVAADADRRGAFSPQLSRPSRWALLAARFFMGGIFIYASIDKIAQPDAFAKDVYNYQILPDALINLTALALPWLELFLGLCLLAGVWVPGAVLAVNGLMVVFTSALVFNMARGLDVNCGCFGVGSDAEAMSTTYYLIRDLVFIAIGAFLFIGVFFPGVIDRKHTRSAAASADLQQPENV